MIKLKITKASGEIAEYEISPAIEFAFEQNFKSGFHKRFRDEEKQSDIYWLAHNALSRVEVIPPFGEEWLGTLIAVEVMDDEPEKK